MYRIRPFDSSETARFKWLVEKLWKDETFWYAVNIYETYEEAKERTKGV